MFAFLCPSLCFLKSSLASRVLAKQIPRLCPHMRSLTTSTIPSILLYMHKPLEDNIQSINQFVQKSTSVRRRKYYTYGTISNSWLKGKYGRELLTKVGIAANNLIIKNSHA